jgi:hypothetical protein
MGDCRAELERSYNNLKEMIAKLMEEECYDRNLEIARTFQDHLLVLGHYAVDEPDFFDQERIDEISGLIERLGDYLIRNVQEATQSKISTFRRTVSSGIRACPHIVKLDRSAQT